MATRAILVCATATIAVLAMAAPISGPAAADPVSPPAAGDGGHAAPQRLFQRFYRASVSASRAAAHLVGFETATAADAATSDIIGDAAQSASDAIVNIAARPDGRRWLSQIHDVRVAVGSAPAVGLKDGSIVVTVCPSDGVSGLPSSFDIQRAVQMAARTKSPL